MPRPSHGVCSLYIGFQQVVASSAVKTVADLTVPAKATAVEIQADDQSVRYTMDDATNPTADVGMVFLVTEPPKTFLIEDLRRIRFIRGAGSDGNLNFHYLAGRDV